MFYNKIVAILVIFSIVINIEGGVLDWFRSKPKWYKLIDKYPLIEAFHPKGLRVSISDVEGMEIFGFHGNLNQCFKRGESGTLYGNVTSPTNGRWIFIDENIELKKDDALHYWIYVKLNGEEHSFSKDVFVIRNLAPHPGNLHLPNNYIDERFDKATNPVYLESTLHNEEKLCKCPVNEVPSFAPVPQPPNTNFITTNNNVVQPTTQLPNVFNTYSASPTTTEIYPEFLFDTSGDIQTELLTCSFQVDSLNEVILDLLKDSNMHSKLVLVGKPQTNNSAMDEIKKFLVNYLELYDLGKKIKTAQYLPCGILFEMSSIIDKKRILLRSTSDMKNVECKFLEPEVAGC